MQEVSLDSLPEELMHSISDIIKLEIPEIVILAERLTSAPPPGKLPLKGTVSQALLNIIHALMNCLNRRDVSDFYFLLLI